MHKTGARSFNHFKYKVTEEHNKHAELSCVCMFVSVIGRACVLVGVLVCVFVCVCLCVFVSVGV